MASLARARAQGEPGHRHLAVGALRVVVLEPAATSSVNTTARAQASSKAPSYQRHGATPARSLARRRSASIPRPGHRDARPRDRTVPAPFQATAAGAPHCRPWPSCYLAASACLRADTHDDHLPCRPVSAPRQHARRPPREAPLARHALPFPSRLRRPDNVPPSAATIAKATVVRCKGRVSLGPPHRSLAQTLPRELLAAKHSQLLGLTRTRRRRGMRAFHELLKFRRKHEDVLANCRHEIEQVCRICRRELPFRRVRSEVAMLS
jgi:hypothetical protein